MKKIITITSLLVVAVFVLTSCGPAGTQGDLYDLVMERGYIISSTDPNYEPLSFMNTEGVRPADTICPSDTFTSAEMSGFDVEVAVAIGDRLGVETCFATPDWDMLTAGSWADKWDLSVGSMTAKPPRPDYLDFTRPYYAVEAVIAVPDDSTYTSVDELDGTTLCVGTATTYEDWLNGILELDPADIYKEPPADVTVISLPTDQECPQNLAAGRTDFVGYVTARIVVESNLAAGMSVHIIETVFSEKNRVSFDKSSSYDTTRLFDEVDQIILDMHNDGTLSALSLEWFDTDLTQDLGE